MARRDRARPCGRELVGRAWLASCRAGLLAIWLASCRAAPPPTDLAEYLTQLAAMEAPSRRDALAAARLDRARWERTIVEPYRGAYADYARAFETALPRLVTQLGRRGAITARAHFAGDPRLTRDQARARWALPVLAPSQVAELDGAPVDAVFVRVAARWFVLTGIDEIVRSRVEPWSARCAAYLEVATPDDCAEILWELADAALRSERERFDRACALAATRCR